MTLIPLLPQQFEPTHKMSFDAPDSHTHNTLNNISSTLLELSPVAYFPLQGPAMLCTGTYIFLKAPDLERHSVMAESSKLTHFL
jgi:hypothetical protein